MGGFFINNIFKDTSYFELFRNGLGLTIVTMMLMLFIATYMVISRYTNGTIKNTVAQGQSRVKIYLSNYITTSVGFGIIYVAFIMINVLVWIIAVKNSGYNVSISAEDVFSSIKVLGLILLIICAMISFYTMLSTVLRSKAEVVTLGMLLMSFIPVFTVSRLNEFMLNRLPFFVVMRVCGTPSDIPLIGTYIITMLGIIIVNTVIGCVVFKKQEIK